LVGYSVVEPVETTELPNRQIAEPRLRL